MQDNDVLIAWLTQTTMFVGYKQNVQVMQQESVQILNNLQMFHDTQRHAHTFSSHKLALPQPSWFECCAFTNLLVWLVQCCTTEIIKMSTQYHSEADTGTLQLILNYHYTAQHNIYYTVSYNHTVIYNSINTKPFSFTQLQVVVVVFWFFGNSLLFW